MPKNVLARKSLSGPRRSAAPSPGTELKSKVSKMMTNHQLLVEELKSQSAARKNYKHHSAIGAGLPSTSLADVRHGNSFDE